MNHLMNMNLESETLEVLRFHMQEKLSKLDRDRWKVLVQDMGDHLVARVEVLIAGKRIPAESARIEVTAEVEYPASLWEHFKQVWFPAWALYRWPVQYATRHKTVFKRVPTVRYELRPEQVIPKHAPYRNYPA